MTDTSKALEALNRIFNYCEEIDNNIPEEERTGYNMLDDIDIIRRTLKELENQKTGHWIGGDVDARGYCSCFECSNCGIFIYPKILLKNLEYPNCPYCLSKMEGE